jgi:hypothetical protein
MNRQFRKAVPWLCWFVVGLYNSGGPDSTQGQRVSYLSSAKNGIRPGDSPSASIFTCQQHYQRTVLIHSCITDVNLSHRKCSQITYVKIERYPWISQRQYSYNCYRLAIFTNYNIICQKKLHRSYYFLAFRCFRLGTLHGLKLWNLNTARPEYNSGQHRTLPSNLLSDLLSVPDGIPTSFYLNPNKTQFI